MSRWWGQNIEIDGQLVRDSGSLPRESSTSEANQWEIDVQMVFRKIEQSRIGKLLMGLIAGVSGKSILVLPIHAANKGQTRAKPVDWTPAMRQGHQFACDAGENCSPNAPPGTTQMPTHSGLIRGSGAGSNVNVFYHPGAWTSSRQMRALDELLGFDSSRFGYGPDDVLFHECVHAYRVMKGIFELVATGDTWRASEEFFAVVLSNIYVSETRPGDPLRGDNLEKFSSLSEAGRPDNDSGFSMKYTTLISQMAREMPEITEPLTATAANDRIGSWNPFRADREMEDKRKLMNTVF